MGIIRAKNRTNGIPTIAHVVLSLEIGGMETVIANIARNLDADRYRQIIVCIRRLDRIGEELRAEGIRVIKANPMTSKISFIYPKAIVDILKTERVDIVHSHSGCWHKAAIAAKISNAKGILHTEHGRTVPDHYTTILLDRLCSKITDYIVPVSRDLNAYLRKTVNLRNSKIVTIYNGVDTNYFTPLSKSNTLLTTLSIPHGAFIVGNVARLSSVKDHATLIKAINIMRRYRPDVRLVIVGDGPEKSKLLQLIKELDLQQNVKILGFRRDIRELLSIFDVFTLSSTSEGTSISILEAMASGKPIIATEVGGNNNLVHNHVNGLLVPPRDYQLLAKYLLNLSSRPDILREMSNRSRHITVTRFSVQQMTHSYENLYQTLI